MIFNMFTLMHRCYSSVVSCSVGGREDFIFTCFFCMCDVRWLCMVRVVSKLFSLERCVRSVGVVLVSSVPPVFVAKLILL